MLSKTSIPFILSIVLVTTLVCVPARRFSSNNMDSYNCDSIDFSRCVLAIVVLVRAGNLYVVVASDKLRRGRFRRESVLFLLCDTGDIMAPNRRFLPRNGGVTVTFLLRRTGVWIFGDDVPVGVDAALTRVLTGVNFPNRFPRSDTCRFLFFCVTGVEDVVPLLVFRDTAGVRILEDALTDGDVVASEFLDFFKLVQTGYIAVTN